MAFSEDCRTALASCAAAEYESPSTRPSNAAALKNFVLTSHLQPVAPIFPEGYGAMNAALAEHYIAAERGDGTKVRLARNCAEGLCDRAKAPDVHDFARRPLYFL